MLAIRFPKDIEERLEKLARSTGRTKTFYAREAILGYLDELEDLYLAEERYREIVTGKVTPLALADIRQRYTDDDRI
jgi:RHH-type rel operon transcriptional repressor/antitoxin RelB